MSCSDPDVVANDDHNGLFLSHTHIHLSHFTQIKLITQIKITSIRVQTCLTLPATNQPYMQFCRKVVQTSQMLILHKQRNYPTKR